MTKEKILRNIDFKGDIPDKIKNSTKDGIINILRSKNFLGNFKISLSIGGES
jgi:hypothetical protein